MVPPPVVFLAFADPPGVAHLPTLGDELRAVREALKAGTDAGRWELVERTGARIDDLLAVLRDPRHRGRVAVFHYGGHAAGDQLMLEAPGGGLAPAHAAGLAQVLGAQRGLALVFLNGCSTAAQADLLLGAGVPAVITTDRAIDDRVATQFASDVYAELAAGEPLERAFVQASAVARTRLGEQPAAAYRSVDADADASRDIRPRVPPPAVAPTLAWPWALRTAPGQPTAATWQLRGPPGSGTDAKRFGRIAALAVALAGAAAAAAWIGLPKSREHAVEALRREGVAVTDTAAFFRFVREENAPLVRLFVAAGFSPNVIEPDRSRGATAGPAVAVAAARGDTTIVALLLRAGARPDLPNRSGYTALASAVEAKSAPVVRQLLAGGADPTHEANDARTVVHDAAAAGDTLILGLLLRAVPPARRAALFAHEGGERYVTPLVAAAGPGQVDAVRMLLRAGAPADVPAARPPLCAASTGLIADVPSDAEAAALHRARHVAVMQLLIAEGHARSDPSCDGHSVLEWPVRAKDTTLVAYLVAHGADPNRAWSDEGPPVRVVVGWCEPAMTAQDLTGMRYLLAHGARADWRPDATAQTPLMLAAARNAPACVDMLLAAGADVNARDGTGRTPLLWGANPWNARVLTALLARGADPRAVDHDGETALTRLVYARGDGETDVVERASAPLDALEVLLRAGVDRAARLADGTTALDIARRNGYRGIAARLGGRRQSLTPNGVEVSAASCAVVR